MELRNEVTIFAQNMEQILRENDHKPGWKNDNIKDLLLRIGDEWWELDEAIKANDCKAIKKEACDIGNFAMMIYDLCSERGC